MCNRYNGPWRLAHRGVCQDAPENTMEAFERAYADEVEGLEIDIRIPGMAKSWYATISPWHG